MVMQEQLAIPGYRLQRRIGRGGMAQVFLAIQESLQRPVAIKVLNTSAEPDFVERFVREAHLVASLRHPAIITIHDIGRLRDGRHYLAMEYLPGGDLTQFRGQPMEPLRALDYARQIASGLAQVHDSGLLHRDIKPANILLREDGSLVIIDFGVAKERRPDSDMTRTGIAVGSPAYASPEQARCLPMDPRSDIYSLGVTLLELLLGRNPFRGESETDSVVNHLQMKPPRLPESLAAYQSLLDRMLAKQPKHRFSDCHELIEALIEAGASDPDRTRIRPAVSLSDQTLTLQRRTRRFGLRYLAAAAGVVLLISVALSTHFGQERETLGELLALAEQRLSEGRLEEPADDSAQHYYLRALAMNPGNQQAQHGLQRVLRAQLDALEALAEQRLADGHLLSPAGDSADHYFRQMLELDSDNPKALEGLQRVLQARLDTALALADQRLAEDQLLYPEEDGAVYYYRQVLGWAPDNERAQQGLQRVVERYVQMSEGAYRRQQYGQALQMVERALEVDPQNPDLLRRQRRHGERVAALEASRRPLIAQRSVETPPPASPTTPAAATPSRRDNNPITGVRDSLRQFWRDLVR